MTPEEALRREGIVLPIVKPVTGSWARTVRSGSLLFVAGHGPFVDGKVAYAGKLGAELTTEAGRKAAEVTTINILATLKAEVGDLSRISRLVRLMVFVNATPDFTEHHLVAYGATDLLVRVFGHIGRAALAEVGVPSLPFNGAVEIEAVVETT